MRYDQLEHAIRAACDVSGDTELLIFGSQSILGTYPAAPESLRASVEVDVQSRNLPEMTDFIDGALGEDSLFHRTQVVPIVVGLCFSTAPAWAVALGVINAFGASGDLIGVGLLALQVPSSGIVRNKGRETWWRHPA